MSTAYEREWEFLIKRAEKSGNEALASQLREKRDELLEDQ